MVKRLLVCAAAILFASTLAVAAQEPAGSTTSKPEAKASKAKAKGTAWHGWVTDNSCGEKGTNADHAACAKKCVDEKGAKYALYTSDKKLYILDPQSDAAPHAGHQVTVKGTLEGDTIHVTSITMKAAKKKKKEAAKSAGM